MRKIVWKCGDFIKGGLLCNGSPPFIKSSENTGRIRFDILLNHSLYLGFAVHKEVDALHFSK